MAKMIECSCLRCGKITLKTPYLARKQRYCSKSCVQLAVTGDVAVPELDGAYGCWLAGFVDGEGSFTIGGTASTHARFALGLRADDRAVLEDIRAHLGFGQVYDMRASSKDRPGARPAAIFVCTTQAACAAIAAIFRRFPLRSKKARDFAVWAEFVDLLVQGTVDASVQEQYVHRIKSARAYPDQETLSADRKVMPMPHEVTSVP